MKKIILIQIFILALTPLLSQELVNINKFASQLMQDEEYYRAITEYKRANSYYPDNNNFTQNLEAIARCYLLADHKIEAINSFKKVLQYDPVNQDAILSIVNTYSQISYFYESNNIIEEYLDIFKGEDRDLLLLNNSLNYINLEKYNQAEEVLNLVETQKYIKKSSEFKHILAELPLKQKKKSTAVISGLILPGSGYFYTGRNQTGFAALVVNLLLGYATYDCFQNDKQGLGIVSGVFFTSFYLGSVYGSIQVVDDYNKEIKINFIKKFKI